MNDIHDSFPMGSRRYTYGLSKFKRDNPDYMMGQEGDWEKYGRGSVRCTWTRLDFAIPEVRDHIFAIIEEVAESYDVDLIGMEFFKYWPFFRESLEGAPVEPEHVETMNDLLRRIRRMADDVGSRRGRPLLASSFVEKLLPFFGWLREASHSGSVRIRRTQRQRWPCKKASLKLGWW